MSNELRLQFLNELEDLFTDPGFPSTAMDLAVLALARADSSVKFKAARYLTDKVARLCNDHRIFGWRKQRDIYDSLLTDWKRFCIWADDPEE